MDQLIEANGEVRIALVPSSRFSVQGGAVKAVWKKEEVYPLRPSSTELNGMWGAGFLF